MEQGTERRTMSLSSVSESYFVRECQREGGGAASGERGAVSQTGQESPLREGHLSRDLNKGRVED